MRFTALFTIMAAGSAIASLQPTEEETTTLTQTTTKYLTVTKCAETNPDCPANQASTSVVPVPVEPTPEPVPTYEVPVPVPEVETSSAIAIVETSSALPEYSVPVPTSSALYPVHNATTHVGPTASVPHTTLSYAIPVVTSTQFVQPSSAPPAGEPSQVAGSGAAGLSVTGAVMALGLAVALF